MAWRGIALAVAVLALAGCTASAPPPAASEAGTASPPAVGGDRDAHGCIPSAGYRWCERSGRCERPWELAKARGFENTAAAFDGYCRVQDGAAG
jgi:hypothetical protein